MKDKFDNIQFEHIKILCKGDDELANHILSLNNIIQLQSKTIEQLENRIKQLEEKINKDSHNSHKPPSGDGFKKNNKTKSLRKKTDKKVGGQKGHEGKTLEMSKTPDKIKKLKVEKCSCCGKSLVDEKAGNCEKRQVIDIPEIKPICTEFQAEVKICSGCNTENVASFPENVTSKVQYGKCLKSTIIYLRHQNFIPCERLGELIGDLFHIQLSEGTIVNTSNKCGMLLEEFENWVKDNLLSSPVLHFDESGISIDGKLNWVHSVSNSYYTYYYPHKKRGKEAIEEIGILPKYKGVAIHDFWQSYLDYECAHGLCNAHHLRELTYFKEELKQIWAEKMIKLLLLIKEEVDKAKEKGKQIDASKIKNFEKKYKRIIYEGLKANPFKMPEKKKRGRVGKGKILNFLERFKNHIKYVLAFMYDPNIPFDNNQAERDIRMAKLHQKISGCFRSYDGAVNFFRIKSFISTVRKNGLDVIKSIEKIFDYKCIYDILTTE